MLINIHKVWLSNHTTVCWSHSVSLILSIPLILKYPFLWTYNYSILFELVRWASFVFLLLSTSKKLSISVNPPCTTELLGYSEQSWISMWCSYLSFMHLLSFQCDFHLLKYILHTISVASLCDWWWQAFTLSLCAVGVRFHLPLYVIGVDVDLPLYAVSVKFHLHLYVISVKFHLPLYAVGVKFHLPLYVFSVKFHLPLYVVSVKFQLPLYAVSVKFHLPLYVVSVCDVWVYFLLPMTSLQC